jgi:1-acyl-sn-glycerol-3-phosphate acyltransferase
VSVLIFNYYLLLLGGGDVVLRWIIRNALVFCFIFSFSAMLFVCWVGRVECMGLMLRPERALTVSNHVCITLWSLECIHKI